MNEKRLMRILTAAAAVLCICAVFAVAAGSIAHAQAEKARTDELDANRQHYREIYFAGGCFWGVEAYYEDIPGVVDVESGYANGPTENPSYLEVCLGSGHAETVHVIYDPRVVTPQELAEQLFGIVDPTAPQREDGASGQYRAGVFYADDADLPVLQEVFDRMALRYDAPLTIELAPLQNFTRAEDKHQDYLDKHPETYCPIGI